MAGQLFPETLRPLRSAPRSLPRSAERRRRLLRRQFYGRGADIDRLTFAGNIIETGTQSYRLAHARSTRAS